MPTSSVVFLLLWFTAFTGMSVLAAGLGGRPPRYVLLVNFLLQMSTALYGAGWIITAKL
jgi:hypothetical protein